MTEKEKINAIITRNAEYDGKLLSKSEWVDEQSVEKWRNNELHRLCQKHGRENDFVDYKITVVTPLRSYTMTERTYAPTDSNQYFGG